MFIMLNVQCHAFNMQELAEHIRPMVIDTTMYIHRAIKNGKKIIVEGAQTFMLDIDFGVYNIIICNTVCMYA